MRIALFVPLAMVSMLSCTEALAPSPARSPEPVRIEVRSPERLPYTPSLLGTGPARVAIVIENRGAETLDVSNLALKLDAARAGLAVECLDRPDARGSSDPSALRPGQSHTFERALDCRLPLAGRYDVAVAVAFGRDRGWRVIRTYALEVVAPPELAPRAIDDSGLYATIGAAPVAGSPTKQGHPRVAIALTNTGATPIELPALRVETRVRRKDTPWTCTSTATRLAAPAALAAGGIHREPFEVSCLGFDVEGAYDVEVVLLVGADRAVSLGHLRIDVQDDDPAHVHSAAQIR